MNETGKRSIFLAVGAAAIALEAIEALAEELLRRGEASTGDGRRLLEEMVERARGEARSLKDGLDGSVRRTLDEMSLPTREKFSDLELRLAQLEHRVKLLEEQADAGAEGDAAAGGKGGEG